MNIKPKKKITVFDFLDSLGAEARNKSEYIFKDGDFKPSDT